MNFWWKSIYQVDSPISGQIEVIDSGHTRKLLINRTTQSTTRPARGSVWTALIPPDRVSSALILGLGGGTVAKLLREKWPEIQIVGYELDEAVVQVAASLDPETEVRIADARDAFSTKEKFDLIVVDTYSKLDYPDFAKEPTFLTAVKNKLNPHGLASFNRIPLSSNKDELENFERDLKQVFAQVWRQKARYNLVFWGKI